MREFALLKPGLSVSALPSYGIGSKISRVF